MGELGDREASELSISMIWLLCVMGAARLDNLVILEPTDKFLECLVVVVLNIKCVVPPGTAW